jgi:hypothetical protein
MIPAALAAAGIALAANKARSADWRKVHSWLWEGAAGTRIYVTRENGHYAVVEGEDSRVLGSGKTLSTALMGAGKHVRELERLAVHHGVAGIQITPERWFYYTLPGEDVTITRLWYGNASEPPGEQHYLGDASSTASAEELVDNLNALLRKL